MQLDLAARRAELTPDRPAVLWQGRWLDYAEMNRRAERLARLLSERGVGAGDRVAILAHNHIAHLDLVLATAKLGFVYAPFNTRLAPTEQASMAAYLRPNLMLHDAEHHAGAAATGVDTFDTADYEAALSAVSLDRPLPRPELSPEHTQMILPTGGTTGVPKGAMLPYRQGFYNAVNTVMSWGLREDDCAVQATPCFHAAMNALTVPLWHAGGRVVLQRSFDPGEYLELAQRAGATILFLVPTMFQMVVEHPAFAAADLSSVRWAIYGGAACPDGVRLALRRRGIVLRQGYGLTEAGVNCFSLTNEQAAARPESVGKPMLHAKAVVRRADGQPCLAGEVGELTLAGPHLFSGYFERPEATAEALKDGWLWTGDLASVAPDGFYRIVGRRKEMFISGGENVYPGEVEQALEQHPGVAQCAVVGVPDERWGEVGLAVVAARSGQTLTADALRAFLLTRLARYKVPKHFRLVDALPKSGAGKILKAELAAAFVAGLPAPATSPGATGASAPRDEVTP